MKATLLLSTAFLLISTHQLKGQDPTPRLEYAFSIDDKAVNPKIAGVWKSIGSGYLLDVEKDSILLYSYTRNHCYREKNDYLTTLLNTQSQYYINNDTLCLFLTDLGEKTQQLTTRLDLVKVDKLPEGCIEVIEMARSGPKLLFEIFIENLEENYAFTGERGLNWEVIRHEYAGKVTDTTDRETLFQIMGEVVTLTGDHHTKIIAKDGRALQFRGTPSAEIVMEAFNNQSEVKSLDGYFNLFFETNYKNISDSLLHGKGEKVANGKIEWGSLNEKIGYIHIHSFAGFAPRGISRKQQIDTINHRMSKIIKSFQDKKAVIVDVSFNFGGYDASGLTIASFFTEKKVFTYKNQVFFNGEFYNADSTFIYPSGIVSYTKPVYLVTTDISRSAAEGFAMAMKALPNVKLAGTATLGILSGMLGKSIGEFYSTCSNQRLLAPDNQYYEVKGVEPDIKMKVFYRENILKSHMNAIRELKSLIEKTW